MQKLTEGLYRLETTGFSNGYLIAEDPGLILVDTGPPGRVETIIQDIQQGGFSLRNLRHIVITHFHHDHVGNAAELSFATGAEVHIHEADADVVRGKTSVPPGKSLLGRILSPLLNMAFRYPAVESPNILGPESRDFLPYQVIHAPGHTPGSVCLFHPEKRVLICGDAINHRGGRLRPPHFLFTMDPDKAWESLKMLCTLDFTMLLPGHGPPILSRAVEQVRQILQQRIIDYV